MFCRFPSLVLQTVLGSPVHYWEIILDSPVHAILGKGSVGSSVPFHRTSPVKRFYKFPSSILGKDSRFRSLEVPKSNTWKRFYRYPCPVLGKGCICSQVQYWKKVVGSPVQYWDKAL